MLVILCSKLVVLLWTGAVNFYCEAVIINAVETLLVVDKISNKIT